MKNVNDLSMNIIRWIIILTVSLLGFYSIIGTGGGDGSGLSVKITSPANKSIFAGSDFITFKAEASDSENKNISESALVWESSLNGKIGIGSPLTIKANSLSNGEHIMTLYATGSKGATKATYIKITIINSDSSGTNKRPTAVILSPVDNATYTEGGYVSLNGAGYDSEDGDLSSCQACFFIWNSSIDGELGRGNSISVDNLSVGQHTITLTVNDSNGAVGTASRTITISRKTPKAKILDPDPNVCKCPTSVNTSTSIDTGTDPCKYTQGNFIFFRGQGNEGTDTNTDILLDSSALVWTSNINGQLGIGNNLTINNLEIGSHRITLTVTDQNGESSVSDVCIRVVDNQNTPPIAQIDNAGSLTNCTCTNPCQYCYNSYIVFNGQGIDREDGKLPGDKLAWYSSLDGFLGNGTSIQVNDLSVGTHTITLIATDSEELTGFTNTCIQILADITKVNIQSPIAGQQCYGEGEKMTFFAQASDCRGIPLSNDAYTWIFPTLNSKQVKGNPIIETLPVGSNLVIVEHTDLSGGTTTAYVTILVDSKPTTKILSPVNNAKYNEGQKISFGGSGIDNEDGDLSGCVSTDTATTTSSCFFLWTSNIDGKLGNTPYITSTDLSVGTHTITLTVGDKCGQTATDTINLEIIKPVCTLPICKVACTTGTGTNTCTSTCTSTCTGTSTSTSTCTSTCTSIGTDTCTNTCLP
ncbi:MAG: PKD domain-containing protein [Desulfobacterales bacterium]|nr:PKD domain-containing protein [Desulfobacterales bacterium]